MSIFSFSIESFAKKRRPFEKAKSIVQFFYYFLAFESLVVLHGGGNLAKDQEFSPVWAIAWTNFASADEANIIIRLFLLLSALVGAFFYRHRLARVIVFLGVWQMHALLSSFLRIDHHWYPWLYISFLLIFLPDVWIAKKSTLYERKKFLLVFFSVQVVTLLMYTMAGFGKLQGAYYQYIQGVTNAFDPAALALHIAYWLRANDTSSLLGSFFIRHPWLGWPLFIGTIYLQLFSLWAAFKPSLHKFWALGLILMHTGIYLTMNMLFLPISLLLLLFFFDSPFRKPHTSWREMVLDLPLFGWILRRIWPRSM